MLHFYQIILSKSVAALRERNEDYGPSRTPKPTRDIFEVCDIDI